MAAALPQPTILHLCPLKQHPISQIMTIKSIPVISTFFIRASSCSASVCGLFSMLRSLTHGISVFADNEETVNNFLPSLHADNVIMTAARKKEVQNA